MYTYCNDVTDWLVVGGDLDLAQDVTGQDYEETIADLLTDGVTHVLDLRCEWEDQELWVAAGLPAKNYRHVPIVDSRKHTPEESWFVEIEDFVRSFWMDSCDGDRLYVHCHMGINRGPSAAMLAMLTVDPLMHPLDAFFRIREARPCAGLIYAKYVGTRHLLNVEGWTAEELAAAGEMPSSVQLFNNALTNYWTPERDQERRAGIAWYRSHEGGTVKVLT